VLFAIVDLAYRHQGLEPPSLPDIWYLAILIPALAGAAVTAGAGGTVLGRRIVQAAVCGVATGALYALAHNLLGSWQGPAELAKLLIWRVFIFTILTVIGAIITELKLPAPHIENS
jgi:hypothetical protein